MQRFRIHLHADITPLDQMFDPLGYREVWAVPHAEADFDFQTRESLADFIKQFGVLLGARE